MHTRATQTFSNVVPTSSDTNILPRGLSLLALCLWYYNGFNSVTAAAHQHKQVAKECRNTSVTSWLLVMSEAYQEEDAVVQLALHLCCCSDAESHSSLGHNNRQPLHLVVWEVIPSKAGREALRHSARAQEAVHDVKATQAASAAAVTAGVSPQAVIKQTHLPVTPSPCQKCCLQVHLEISERADVWQRCCRKNCYKATRVSYWKLANKIKFLM